MVPTESIDKTSALQGAVPAPTVGTFIHAACVANLLVATVVLIVFSVVALNEHAGATLQLGLSLIPFVTLVVWISATVDLSRISGCRAGCNAQAANRTGTVFTVRQVVCMG